ADNAVFVCYVNLVGGQDELVFDGSSTVFDAEGELIARAPAFEEHLLVTDLSLESLYLSRLHNPLRRVANLAEAGRSVERIFVSGRASRDATERLKPEVASPLSEEAEVYKALVTGTRDYVHK